MANWKERLKEEWNNNPLQTILVGSLAAGAASKLLDSVSSARSRRAYAKQIDYKVKHRR